MLNTQMHATADLKNTPLPHYPAFMLNASQKESSPKEKTSHSSLVNIMEGAPNIYHHLPAYHCHHNLNRALLFRVPQHNQNVQHSQRNLGHNSGTSTSQGKTNPPSKFGYQPEPRSGYTERRENATRRPEIGISNNNALAINVVSANAMKMLCGLCSVSTSDLCVAAVLVCGHVYHADCLETKTPYADRRDPPCPLCVSSHSVD